MISDSQCNVVFYSALLESQIGTQTFERIREVLELHSVEFKGLTNTKDIWCRDYMPIQLEKSKFVQFRYEPSYLIDYPELRSMPKEVLKSNGITAQFSDINLDGGNVVRWKDKVILTERVFAENQIDATTLTHKLETLFEANVYFIPDISGDMTGHADGHVRFIDGNTVLVNELNSEYKYWQEGFLKMIKRAKLDFVEMPWFVPRDKRSAIGIYVNYLEVCDLILFPVFDVPNNRDQEALQVIQDVFPWREIVPININEIGQHGGLLNCVTWSS